MFRRIIGQHRTLLLLGLVGLMGLGFAATLGLGVQRSEG